MVNYEREITIEYLKGIQEKYVEGEGYDKHPLPEWYALDNAIKTLEQEDVLDKIREDNEAIDLAIKALEAQPFINKPCISEGVCREDKIQVLDKIRAEIERRKKNSGGDPSRDLVFNVCLQIIDKYKAESEDTE